MNKKILVGISIVFSLLITPFVFISAQVYDIPTPVCYSTPEIPCPGDEINPTKVQKPSSPIITIPKEGDSKTFNEQLKPLGDMLKLLIKDINNTMTQIIASLTGFFDNVKHFFEKIKI